MCEYRVATKNDFSKICALVTNEEELFWVYPSGQFPLTVDQLMKLSRERKDLTVVVENERIIGFANLYNHIQGKSAFIGNVVIDKCNRGKGIGRNLILYMLERARKIHNLNEVHISVFNENTPALLLYSTLGFTPYGMEERSNPKGKKVLLIHMKMMLEN